MQCHHNFEIYLIGDFLQGFLGYPCLHRRLKKYITLQDEKPAISSWALLYKHKYIPFVKQKGEQRVLAYATFHRYVHGVFGDYAFTRAKEDCCNTCERLTIAMSDPNLPANERAMIKECLDLHQENALESRKAYHTVIREWGSKTLPSDDLVVRNKFEVALCNLPEFVDDSLNDVIPETDRCHRILLQCEDFSGNTKLPCDEFGVDLPINIFATNPAIATAICNDGVLFETNSPKKTRTMS